MLWNKILILKEKLLNCSSENKWRKGCVKFSNSTLPAEISLIFISLDTNLYFL